MCQGNVSTEMNFTRNCRIYYAVIEIEYWKKKYNNCHKQSIQFSSEWNKDHLHHHLNNFQQFLHFHQTCNVFNTIRSMLSSSIEIDSMEVRKHPTLFMNRLVPKLNFT